MIASLSVEKANGYGVLSAIGNTPLVELKNIFRDSDFRLFVKSRAATPVAVPKTVPPRTSSNTVSNPASSTLAPS